MWKIKGDDDHLTVTAGTKSEKVVCNVRLLSFHTRKQAS